MRFLLFGVGGLAGLYLLVAAGLFLMQRHILFRPDTERPDLARSGLTGVRELDIRTADGLSLLAWYAPPVHEGGYVVLALHGNAGHIGHRGARFTAYTARGWGVLMPEYRGYGGNPGRPSEAGLIEDASAALATLQDMGFPLERIVLWGESLGSGLASRLAVDRAAAAVVLEAPYTSIAAMARLRYPFVPVDWLLRDRFDTLSIIGQSHAPVLVLHGARDQIIPVAMGQALFAAAPSPKDLWIAPEAGHIDLIEAGAVDAAVRFLDRTRPVPNRIAARPDQR